MQNINVQLLSILWFNKEYFRFTMLGATTTDGAQS